MVVLRPLPDLNTEFLVEDKMWLVGMFSNDCTCSSVESDVRLPSSNNFDTLDVGVSAIDLRIPIRVPF